MKHYRIIWQRSFGYSIEVEAGDRWRYIPGTFSMTKWGAYWQLWRVRRRKPSTPDRVVVYDTHSEQGVA